MLEDFIASQLDLCRDLLAQDRARVGLSEIAPEHYPASLGAMGGVGFEAKDPDVAVSVYFFEGVEHHEQAVEQLLRATPTDEGSYILHCSNGGMLFFGHTRIDGPNGKKAEHRLADIASAFAGDEEGR